MDASAFEPPPILTLLAHEIRWHLVRALALNDYRVHELVEFIGRPLNLVSYHLKQLRLHHIVSERRSSADARDVYYHLDVERLQTLFLQSGETLHPAIASRITDQIPVTPVFDPPVRILFLCTHNSARSQMAEGLARTLGNGGVDAYSAGNLPSHVHPDAVQTMANIDIDISQQTSKSLDQFVDQSFDAIVTVCDRVRESCSLFPTDPERIHWSFHDPSLIDDPQERHTQFHTIARELTARIGYLLIFLERKRIIS